MGRINHTLKHADEMGSRRNKINRVAGIREVKYAAGAICRVELIVDRIQGVRGFGGDNWRGR
jgi:hypothetical protein